MPSTRSAPTSLRCCRASRPMRGSQRQGELARRFGGGLALVEIVEAEAEQADTLDDRQQGSEQFAADAGELVPAVHVAGQGAAAGDGAEIAILDLQSHRP